MSRQPMQPVEVASDGVLRFKPNKLVQFLLDNNGKIDMNMLASIDVPREDREQFAQLIGYSLSGFSALSYATDESYLAAVKMHEKGMSETAARLSVLTDLVMKLRAELREPMAELFGVHPDDLKSQG
jgi:hypothetical protein